MVQTLLNEGCSVKLDFHGVRLVTRPSMKPSFKTSIAFFRKTTFSLMNLPISFPRHPDITPP